MAAFLSNNLGTILVLLVVCALAVLAVVKMISDRKKGKSSCGCGCKNCPSAGVCHKK